MLKNTRTSRTGLESCPEAAPVPGTVHRHKTALVEAKLFTSYNVATLSFVTTTPMRHTKDTDAVL
jgi:hypothetical protein